MTPFGAFLFPAPANADCSFSPTGGNEDHICDSGTAPGLTDAGGDNTLTFPPGGSGTIDGDVTFGAGMDSILMDSGTITGTVDQGDGEDSFVINAGTVGGNVQQGSGIDDFQMTGGQIQSLNQGDALDTFFMSNGRIVDFFEDGDEAVMTGGRIGRVNLKLDDNLFDMSGGIIDGNLVAGFGNDTIILSNGTIGGNISVSGGTDNVTVTGGSVGGDVRMSFGEDTFTWDGGGIISGDVNLGGDDDTATLANLTNANLGATPLITGGDGTDALTFDNASTAGLDRFQRWETIDATNDTELTFDGDLVLGDSGTGTGTLTVDSTSTLFGGGANAAVTAFTSGQLVNVLNSGRIDLTDGGDSTSDTFTIVGDYEGDGGLLLLNTELGDDSSPSDKLAISGGTASGSTGLSIVNAGGAGATTTQDGIMVVEAVDGGQTESGAFALNDSVAAGAFEYFLFKGGVSDGTEENWYLRSTLVQGPELAAAPGATPPIPGAKPPTPGATQVTGDVVQLYRVEVPTYAVVPPLAQHLAVSTLGTFHERRGEQMLLEGPWSLPNAWGRVFGQNTDMEWDGTVDPSFDGHFYGFQAGMDLFGRESAFGHNDRVGAFFAIAGADGDIKGQALGWNDLAVGSANLNGASLGAYWTHIGPTGWYLDGVAMATWFYGDATSDRDVGVDTDGTGITLSLEGGYPIALASGWTLEPQAQIIWHHLSLDDTHDEFSSVSFDSDDGVTGRLGLRLQGELEMAGRTLQPYLKANLWHGFDGDDVVDFEGTPIVTERGGTALELGGGVIAQLTASTSLYAVVDYTFDLDGDKQEIFEGNLGISMTW